MVDVHKSAKYMQLNGRRKYEQIIRRNRCQVQTRRCNLFDAIQWTHIFLIEFSKHVRSLLAARHCHSTSINLHYSLKSWTQSHIRHVFLLRSAYNVIKIIILANSILWMTEWWSIVAATAAPWSMSISHTHTHAQSLNYFYFFYFFLIEQIERCKSATKKLAELIRNL